jgi:hypothetical protein
LRAIILLSRNGGKTLFCRGDSCGGAGAGPPSEIAPVAASVSASIGQLNAAFEAERSFPAHSAHELRAPVATSPRPLAPAPTKGFARPRISREAERKSALVSGRCQARGRKCSRSIQPRASPMKKPAFLIALLLSTVAVGAIASPGAPSRAEPEPAQKPRATQPTHLAAGLTENFWGREPHGGVMAIMNAMRAAMTTATAAMYMAAMAARTGRPIPMPRTRQRPTMASSSARPAPRSKRHNHSPN